MDCPVSGERPHYRQPWRLGPRLLQPARQRDERARVRKIPAVEQRGPRSSDRTPHLGVFSAGREPARVVDYMAREAWSAGLLLRRQYRDGPDPQLPRRPPAEYPDLVVPLL